MVTSLLPARALACAGVLAAAPIATVAAQRATELRVGLTSPVATVPARDAVEAALRPAHKSYWREGGVITALAAVIAVNALVDAYGEGSSTPLGERLLGSAFVAVVFFVPGALIGGLIPKK